TEVRLVEVQLLTNRLREHKFDDEDLGSVEDHIGDSASRMAMALDGRKCGDLSALDVPVMIQLDLFEPPPAPCSELSAFAFPVPIYPANFADCPFRKPC